MTYLKAIKKNDWISLLVIWLLFFFMVFISYARWGNPIVDCFRNAYVPDEILAGNILYKDVYYIYGPLIVYFHSLLFKIFGINLHVLYFSGIVASFSIVNLLYYLARQLFKPLMAAVFGCMYVVLVIFRPGIFQYIFPYSYEAVYGLIFLLVVLVCLVNIIKNDFKFLNQFYIVALIISICPFVKQDVAISAYGIFYAFIIGFLLLKKIKIKDIIKPLLVSIFGPVIIFGILCLFIPYNDLFSGLFPIGRFNNFYLEHFAEMGLSLKFLLMSIKSFLITVTIFFAVVALFMALQALLNKLNLTKSVFLPLIIISTCITIYMYHETLVTNLLLIPQFTFGWFQWAVVFVIVFVLFKIFAIYFRKRSFNLKNDELIFMLFAVSAVIFLFRNPVSVNLQSVNNVFIFPALLSVFYIFGSFVPSLLNKTYEPECNLAFLSTVVVFTFVVLVNNINIYNFKTLKVDNNRGIFYLSPYKGMQIKKTIAFIEKYTTPEDKIFTPPEDLIYNFMTGRHGATKFYQLVPGMISSYEEEKLTIDELKDNNTKLILVSTNDNVKRYGKIQWGSDYNSTIFNWITENYIPLTIISNNFPNSNVLMPYRVFVFINKNDYKPDVKVF